MAEMLGLIVAPQKDMQKRLDSVSHWELCDLSRIMQAELDRVIGDVGNEMEIKDASGRYRHARRAPVNENTLQPMRRVSKAGLESLIQG